MSNVIRFAFYLVKEQDSRLWMSVDRRNVHQSASILCAIINRGFKLFNEKVNKFGESPLSCQMYWCPLFHISDRTIGLGHKQDPETVFISLDAGQMHHGLSLAVLSINLNNIYGKSMLD